MSYLQKFDELTLSKCKEMTKPEQMALNTLALGGVKPSSNGGFVVAKPMNPTALGEFLSMRGMQVTSYPPGEVGPSARVPPHQLLARCRLACYLGAPLHPLQAPQTLRPTPRRAPPDTLHLRNNLYCLRSN